MRANTSTLKRIGAVGFALLLVASLGVGSVASTTQDAEGEPAEVRVAHMSPDAPEVDVLVDNETAFQAVAFSDVTEFVELESGDHQVTIVTADNETEVYSAQISVRANESYTLMASGEVSENGTRAFGVQAYRTDPGVPSENQSAVRLIHASPDAPAVDVTLRQSGDVVADNVSFGNATDYMTLPEGAYTFEVRPATADNNGTVIATFNESLMGGTAYSTFAAGYAAPDEAPVNESLSLFVAVDAGGQVMETQQTDRAEQPDQPTTTANATTEA